MARSSLGADGGWIATRRAVRRHFYLPTQTQPQPPDSAVACRFAASRRKPPARRDNLFCATVLCRPALARPTSLAARHSFPLPTTTTTPHHRDHINTRPPHHITT